MTLVLNLKLILKTENNKKCIIKMLQTLFNYKFISTIIKRHKLLQNHFQYLFLFLLLSL